jgi:hypothetical protein
MVTAMRSPSNLPQPTRELGQHGLDLWTSIQSEYLIEDAAGIEVLMEACAALDRAESLAAQIAADGVTVAGPSGSRVNPCIAGENQSRTLVVRCLARLGLDQPIRPVGPGPKRKKEPLDDDE